MGLVNKAKIRSPSGEYFTRRMDCDPIVGVFKPAAPPLMSTSCIVTVLTNEMVPLEKFETTARVPVGLKSIPCPVPIVEVVFPAKKS